MMDGAIVTNFADGVLEIVIDRPRRKNALTRALYEGLISALHNASSDGAVRAAVISGAGGAFTAGNDIADFLEAPPAGPDSPVFRFLHALVDFEKPLIAAVEGPAVGIGTTMLLHCDLVYAADTARFSLPFVNLGLVPEGGSSLLLPRLMGRARAGAALLLGEPFDAHAAREAGLVLTVDAAPLHLERARAAAAAFVHKAPAAVRASKALLRRWDKDEVKRVLAEEGALFAARLVSPEAEEAFRAFLEKRAPDFSRFA